MSHNVLEIHIVIKCQVGLRPSESVEPLALGCNVLMLEHSPKCIPTMGVNHLLMGRVAISRKTALYKQGSCSISHAKEMLYNVRISKIGLGVGLKVELMVMEQRYL